LQREKTLYGICPVGASLKTRKPRRFAKGRRFLLVSP
jgi:hypothetical protein